MLSLHILQKVLVLRTEWILFQRIRNFQANLELIGRQRFEVRCAVGGGIAVGLATIVLDNDHVLAFADVFRTLKHHVFEEMSKSRLSHSLVTRSGVVCYCNRIRRRGMIFGEDDAKTVLQGVLFENDTLRAGRLYAHEEQKWGQKNS